MPEGDTVFKLARYMGPALRGRQLAAGYAHADCKIDLDGLRIEDVYSLGKHLFIVLDDGHLLRSHLGMWGSWHSYAPDEAWQKPRHRASILLDIGDRLFVCFSAAQVELLRINGVRHRTLLATIGPDLLAKTVDFEEIRRRVLALGNARTLLVDLLLDQRVASGIGNVYKSEVMFLGRWHPDCRIDDVTEDQLLDLYRLASELLNRNLGGGPRVTRIQNDDAGGLWVYRRAGQACLRCQDGRVVSAKLGKGQRSTYWCPECQPSAKAQFSPADRTTR